MNIIRRFSYRVNQFFQELLGPLLPVDDGYARQRLNPELYDLFRRMPRAGRRHGIATCRGLESLAATDPELLAAALLHDVGKTVQPLFLWEKVMVVAVEYFAPKLAAGLRQGRAGGPWRGFVLRHRHPGQGADLARAAGASLRVEGWIRLHHDPAADDPDMVALQAADDNHLSSRRFP